MSTLDAAATKFIETDVCFFEMHAPPDARAVENSDVLLSKMEKPISAERYLHYYRLVGQKFCWIDRLLMPAADLYTLVNAGDTDIYVLRVKGQEAGYVELIIKEGAVEILYFGLFPEFHGTGLGKHFLQMVIDTAWSYGPRRVQLNTCSLDHPHAIENYTKRGFKLVKTTKEPRRVWVSNDPGNS